MQSRFAFITGINGQDGSYLSELLLEKGYEVYGIHRRCSHSNTVNIDHLRDEDRFHLTHGDITDLSGLQRELEKIKKAMSERSASRLELYHLAAQSHVGVSFKVPVATLTCNATGTLNVLEAVRSVFHLVFDPEHPHAVRGGTHSVRIYFAGTSELFGKVQAVPQTEQTPFTRDRPMPAPNCMDIGR